MSEAERLRRVEDAVLRLDTELPHLATKETVADVRTAIETRLAVRSSSQVTDPAEKRTAERRLAYQTHRDRIVQEDQLINYRMTWLLYWQAMLFALWGSLRVGLLSNLQIKLQPLDIKSAHAILIFISVSAILVAFAALLSIKAARDEIRRVRERYICLYSENDPVIPGLTAGRELDIIGHMLTNFSPLFFVLFWIVLLWLSILLAVST